MYFEVLHLRAILVEDDVVVCFTAEGFVGVVEAEYWFATACIAIIRNRLELTESTTYFPRLTPN